MKEKFTGKAILLDRDNINTDEIIPAKYLTYVDKNLLKPHLLEDLKLDGFHTQIINWEDINIVIGKSNFGCGSSREMAVWAFEENGINVIIASNFARIFRENAIYSGILPIEIGNENINIILKSVQNLELIEVSIDLSSDSFFIKNSADTHIFKFRLTKFEKSVINNGGLVDFALKNY